MHFIAQTTPSDPVAKADAHEASQIKFSSEIILPLLVAFVIGGFTSAWWILRQGRRPKVTDLVSSIICSGLVAVLMICWLWDANMGPHKLILISILCGFSGEILIRALVINMAEAAKSRMGAIFSAIFGASPPKTEEKPKEDKQNEG